MNERKKSRSSVVSIKSGRATASPLVRLFLGLTLVPFLASTAAAGGKCIRHVYNDSQHAFRIVIEYTGGYEPTRCDERSSFIRNGQTLYTPFPDPPCGREWIVQPYSSIEIVYYGIWDGSAELGEAIWDKIAGNNTFPQRLYIFYRQLTSSVWDLNWSGNCTRIEHSGSTAWANLVVNSPADGDINILPH